jgi:hypothetical protein
MKRITVFLPLHISFFYALFNYYLFFSSFIVVVLGGGYKFLNLLVLGFEFKAPNC